MQRNILRAGLLVTAAIAVAGCSATQHRAEVQDDTLDSHVELGGTTEAARALWRRSCSDHYPVTVDLLDSNGATLATATTAGDGDYQFTALPWGEYSVSIRTATFSRSVSPGNVKAWASRKRNRVSVLPSCRKPKPRI